MPVAPPRADLLPNTLAYETTPLVAPCGFREYDARWRLGPELNYLGMEAVGLGLGTYVHELGVAPRVVVGHDFRSYSINVKQALTLGLVTAGCEVLDIGLALSPMAYFAQFDLEAPCVAMVTASHNDNGWTGVKMGASPPLTFGPEEIARLRDIVLGGHGVARAGGRKLTVDGVAERYIAEVAGRCRLKRPLKAVVACGNGTAGAFAPEALARMGAEVVPLDCGLDFAFPRYNPNPESHAMLRAMGEAVRREGADLCLGFDGDGDRCGVVDETGEEIFADKIGLLIARDLSARHRDATFVVDVKSTGLYASDEVLRANGATVLYGKTGHSHIKRQTAETGALAAFEKSGHFVFAPPLGRGYDDGLAAAAAVLNLLDSNPGRTLHELTAALPPVHTSLTMSAHCDDARKYAVVEQVTGDYLALASAAASLLGRRIRDVLTVNGARVTLEDGSWLLVRASSNTPELVVVVESTRSADDMRALFREEVKPRLARYPHVGAYNQEI